MRSLVTTNSFSELLSNPLKYFFLGFFVSNFKLAAVTNKKLSTANKGSSKTGSFMFETCMAFLVLITSFRWCTWMHHEIPVSTSTLWFTQWCVFSKWTLKYPEVPVCVCPKYHPELGYGCSLLVFILGSPGHPNTLLVEGFNNLQCQKLGLIQNIVQCLQMSRTVEMLLL